MVAVQEVRNQIADLKRLGPGLVAVFVGGTSGIGESTAREFVRYATKPRVYLIGRNQEQANHIASDCREINPESQVNFIPCDASLLRNVDEVCSDIIKEEDKINLLFLSAGIITMKGRDETPEGLDKKFSLNYYSRLRFTQNLLPLLKNAAAAASSAIPNSPVMARVISVLGAGFETTNLFTSDLSLKNNFGLRACANHATTMTTLSFQHLAASNPAVSFIHTSPGGVKTNVGRELGKFTQAAVGMAMVFLTPFMMPLKECGERHVWASLTESLNTGSHTIGQTGDAQNNGKVLEQLQQSGMTEKVWAHTMDVFKKVCDDGEKY